MKDKDAKAMWSDLESQRLEIMIENISREIERRESLIAEDNRLDNQHHRREVEKLEDENPQLGHMRAKAKQEMGIQLTDDDNAELAKFEGDTGSQQGTIDRYMRKIAETLGADRSDDYRTGEPSTSLLQDRSLGQSTYKFAKHVLKELAGKDLSDTEEEKAWLAKIIPTYGPREFGFSERQQNNLYDFFKRTFFELENVARWNGQEQVEREITYIIQAFDELESMDPDDIDSLGIQRLSDPE